MSRWIRKQQDAQTVVELPFGDTFYGDRFLGSGSAGKRERLGKESKRQSQRKKDPHRDPVAHVEDSVAPINHTLLSNIVWSALPPAPSTPKRLASLDVARGLRHSSRP